MTPAHSGLTGHRTPFSRTPRCIGFRKPTWWSSVFSETLRPTGRFVAEFGGAGNVGAIVSAARSVLEPEGLFSWPNQYYPTAEAYAGVLEQGGLRVRRVELVPRLTRLQGQDGLRTWLRMFRGELLDRIPADRLDSALGEIEDAARPQLYMNGAWHADYVRLRVEAHRP